MPARPSPDITELLQTADTDQAAREAVIGAVYQELRRLARRILVGDRARFVVAPTELVHGAALKLLAQDRVSARDKAHFLAYSGQVMRQVLIDHVRHEQAAKRDGGTQITLVSTLADASGPDADALALHAVLDELAQVSPDLARLVEQRYYAGMTVEEIAVVEGTSSATVKRQWRVARAWLQDRLKPA